MSIAFNGSRLHEYVARNKPWIEVSSLLPSLAFLVIIVIATSYFFGHPKQHGPPKGCRKLGLQGHSHLADEYDERYRIKVPAESHQNGSAKTATVVKSLWVYPVKSCSGVELDGGSVVATGMEFDRLFCFAQLKSPFPVSLNTPDAEKSKHQWEFITQRKFSTMALIKTELWVPDVQSPTYSPALPEVKSGGVVVIKFPSVSHTGFMGALSNVWTAMGWKGSEKVVHIPLNPTAQQIEENGYEMEEMKIWKDTPQCLNMGTTIAPRSQLFLEELQALLGCTNPLALFRITSEHPREVYRCAPRKEMLGWQPKVAFGDAYPLHIMNLASVRDVETKIERGPLKLSARRFRPNIIITGLEAYAEDAWKRIKIGDDEFHVSCRTVRCLLPNVDPATGQRHPSEPNRTLKSFRCIDEGDIKNACLGMQLVCAKPESYIQIGDPIEVLETGDHYYIRQ